MKTFYVQTLGCKVNQYESEQIATLLRSRGLTQVDSMKSADVRVVNTCSVTREAAAKSGQISRRATRDRNAKTIVTGCWATSDPHAARNTGADTVLGHHDDLNENLHRLIDRWKSIDPQTNLPCSTGMGTHRLPLLTDRQSSQQRAFLKIQDGCDAHCTYCIIPQLRSTLWSKPIDDAVREARSLVDAGHKEIVLTGIFLGAFGESSALRRRQPSRDKKPLADLIEALCTRVPGLIRLRFSSLEPADLTPRLLATMRQFSQIVPHFHLPLQSGSDEILRKMNRQYRRDDFLKMIETVREIYDRPAITTDIIAGFPGETDERFNETLDIVQRTKFIHIHAFPFSARPNTAAARWTTDFVPAEKVRQRINLLNSLGANFGFEFRKSFLNENVQILIERDGSHGRCERYFDVQLESAARAGELVNAKIVRTTFDKTFARDTGSQPVPPVSSGAESPCHKKRV